MKRFLLFLIFLLHFFSSRSAVDLTITGTNVQTLMYRGITYPIAVTIKNTGTTSTSTTFIVNVSINSVAAYSGQTYLTEFSVNGLAAGASLTLNTNIQIPCTYSIGTRYILFAVDALNAVSESNESNNQSFPSFLLSTLPELVPLNYSLTSSTITAGNSLTANFAVNNLGGTSAGVFNVGFYLSTSTTLNVGQATNLGTYSVSSVSSCSQTSLLSKTLSIPTSICSGTYYVHMWIDNGLSVSEVDDNNNFQYITLSVTGVSPPPAPNALFGDPSNPSLFTTNTTPTLTWVGSGNTFWVQVSKCPYGSSNIIYSVGCVSGSSHTIPAGNLLPGRLYRWNMYAGNTCCTSSQSSLSNTRYFNIPPIISAGGSTAICNGGTVTLQTDFYSDASYQWLLNGSNIPGATSSTYTASAVGNYTVINTFSCGSTVSSNNINVTINSCCTPTTQASNIYFTNIQSTSVTVNWASGNGDRRIVKIHTAPVFNATPDGTDPIANPSYSGQFNQVVYNGNGNSINVTNLNPNSVYYFYVTEAKCNGSLSTYLNATSTNNPNNITTLAALCVTWQNGITPSNPLVATATEYLCQHNIIDNFQDVQELLGFSLGQAAEVSISGLYNGNVPATLPSDNLPTLVTDIQVLPFYQYQATKALCYLDGTDGRPCINRDYYTIQPKATAGQGRILRMLLEGWNIAPDTSGYDIYSHTASSFLCNVLKDDPNYGYFKKAYQLGLINDFITGGCFTYSSPGEFLYVILYKLHSQNSSPSITASSYFEPNNFDPKNVGNETGIERAVFQTYEQSGFSLPSGGLGLDFDYSYHSSLLEYPTIAEDWQGRNYGNLENHKAVLKNFPLGKGWTHSYNIFANILRAPNNTGIIVETNILFHWGDGSIYIYSIITSQFETKGIYDNFIIDAYNGNGDIQQFHIVTKSKITYRFYRSNDQFYCTYITDRNNNKIRLDYELAECNSSPATCVGTTISRLAHVFDSSANRVLNFLYQPNTDLLSEVKDTIGRSIKFYSNKLTYNLDSTTNARSNTTKYKYCNGDTCNNMLIEIQRPKGNWIKNTYAKRKLKQTQTPNYTASVNFSTNYNPGNQTTQSIIQTTPDVGYGYSTTYQHNALGLPTSVTSATSSTTVQYNDAANPTLPTNILDNLTGITNTNTYDTKGNNLISTITGGALSQTTTKIYNSNNDITQVQLPNGSIFNNSYDAKGNLISETGPLGLHNEYTRNTNGTISTTTNANNFIATVDYNGFGNPNKISVNGTSIQSEAFYDNASRITHVKDAKNTVSKYLYDNNDNIVQTITDTIALKLTTNYRFDANDNNDLIVAPKGDSTKLTYDLNDDLVQEDYGPFNRKWFYYEDGSLKGFHTKDGTSLNNVYYPSGSLFEGKLQQNFLNTYDYDSTTRVLKKVTSYNGFPNSITYSYDALSRPVTVEFNNSTPAVNNVLQYEYDISNFQTKIIIPELNKFYKYVPDALNRVSEVYDWNNVLLIKYIYRPDGQMDSEQLGNGANVLYHYDNAGRLDSIYAKKSDNTLLYSTGASLDNIGNHTRESLFIKKDSLQSIISQVDSITSFQYDFATNRLTSANGQTVVSDNNGNIIKDNYRGFNSGVSNATYDNLNNLLSCNVDGRQYSFRYNAYNNRFIVDTFRRVVDVLNNGNLIVNKGISGTALTLYCHCSNGLVCSIDPVSNARKWYLYDFRGSTVAILNDNQNVEQYYKYDPFGAIEESSHMPGTKTPFLYIGKYGVEYNSPHMYYMRARYYDSNNGRFYGEDPVWGTNLFSYARNNPIINIDPNGQYVTTQYKLGKVNLGYKSINTNLNTGIKKIQYAPSSKSSIFGVEASYSNINIGNDNASLSVSKYTAELGIKGKYLAEAGIGYEAISTEFSKTYKLPFGFHIKPSISFCALCAEAKIEGGYDSNAKVLLAKFKAGIGEFGVGFGLEFGR